MLKINTKQKLFLCAGLQSSGSTFISWCFLQRQDMNGFFDANNDILTDISPNIGQPYVWYKTTISCFRMSELVTYYEEAGWDVQPILVIRDPRHVWNSLAKKKYGRNGTTAEDPPLRMRMRRFKEDWEYFQTRGWPIIRFESFLMNPEVMLRETCKQAGLCWDASMVTWPKSPSEIADMRHGSRTFKVNRNQGLNITHKSESPHEFKNILSGDLKWLETEFKEFNRVNEYPAHLDISYEDSSNEDSRLIPQFFVTRRNKWKLRRKPFRWMAANFRTLIFPGGLSRNKKT